MKVAPERCPRQHAAGSRIPTWSGRTAMRPAWPVPGRARGRTVRTRRRSRAALTPDRHKSCLPAQVPLQEMRHSPRAGLHGRPCQRQVMYIYARPRRTGPQSAGAPTASMPGCCRRRVPSRRSPCRSRKLRLTGSSVRPSPCAPTTMPPGHGQCRHHLSTGPETAPALDATDIRLVRVSDANDSIPVVEALAHRGGCRHVPRGSRAARGPRGVCVLSP